jgi:hypothetical protein
MSFLLKIVVFHAIVPSCLHLHISSLSIGKCQYIWGYCENMTTIIQDEQYSKSHQSHHTIFIYVLHINYTIYIIPYNTILSYIYTHVRESFCCFHMKLTTFQVRPHPGDAIAGEPHVHSDWRRLEKNARNQAMPCRFQKDGDDIGWYWLVYPV